MQPQESYDLWSFIKENWYSVGATVAVVLAWFKKNITDILRHRQNTDLTQEEINKSHLENLEETFNLYRGIIDDLVQRYESKILELNEEIANLKAELSEVKKLLKRRNNGKGTL